MINKKLQRAFGIGALVLALGTGIVGCGRKVIENKTELKRIEIKAGECMSTNSDGLTLSNDVFAYKKKGGIKKIELAYNGMNNEKTFSLSHGGYSAVNVYYPLNSKEIQFRRDKFKVVEVTPEHIVLDYLGESTENK